MSALAPTIDIGDYLRRKKLQDMLSGGTAPAIGGGAAPGADPSLQAPTTMTAPVGPPVTPPPQNPDEQRLRDLLASQPQRADYHPSKTRGFLSTLAGIGYGAATGSPMAGIALAKKAEYAPFEKQMQDWQSRAQQAQSLVGLDVSQQKTAAELGKTKAETEAAIAAQEAHKQASLKDIATAEKERRIGAAEAGSFAEKHQADLELEAAKHPEKGEKFTISEDKEKGIVNVLDTGTGKVTTTKYADVDPNTVPGAGTYAELQRAQKLIDDQTIPETSPLKKAARIFVKSVQDAKAPQTLMLGAPDPTGARTAMTVTPGTTVPAGAMSPQQAGQEQVNQDKQLQTERQARKQAVDDYNTAKKLAAKGDGPSDAALVVRFMGAIKPDNLQKMRFTTAEQNFLLGTRSTLGDLEALANKVRSGQKLIPEQRKQMLDAMRTIAGIDEESPAANIVHWEKGPNGIPRRVGQ